MKYNKLRPLLWTENMNESVDFYTNVLGFTCNEKNDDWGWASLSKDEVDIMLCKPNEHIPFNGCTFTGSLYIDTTGVNELWDAVKSKAKVCYELETFEWGMSEFAVYDNNGYIIQFGEELNGAAD
jgi:uncharacterized glyoxalase superfamily protein PhnB